MPYKILVIDDQINDKTYPLFSLLAMLETEGYEVKSTADPEKAWDLVFEYLPDLIVLDLRLGLEMSPKEEGFGIEFLRQIRTEGYSVPVILITAIYTETEDVKKGFEEGADDYVRLPCDNAELLARIGANLPGGISKVNCRLLIDFVEQRVWVAGVEVPFAPLEFKLLDVLVRNAPRVVPSNTLIDRVWEKDVSDDVLAVFINRLRAKIELDPHDPIFIKTIRNVGYRFTIRPERMRENQRRRAARARPDILLRRPPCEPTG
jgi:DNA-binding response OmpR family regulator